MLTDVFPKIVDSIVVGIFASHLIKKNYQENRSTISSYYINLKALFPLGTFKALPDSASYEDKSLRTSPYCYCETKYAFLRDSLRTKNWFNIQTVKRKKTFIEKSNQHFPPNCILYYALFV